MGVIVGIAMDKPVWAVTSIGHIFDVWKITSATESISILSFNISEGQNYVIILRLPSKMYINIYILHE